MLYHNESRNACSAMEYARTGGYGDYYYGKKAFECPCCGAADPDAFFIDENDECVGCCECVYASQTPWG